MTRDAFDAFVTRLDGALLVVTAATEDQRAGCVVGFHTQCSIDPPRYAVWLSKANFTYRVALFSTHLALHMVGADDRLLVQLFGGTSGDHTEKFALVNWAPGPGGVPLLAQCPSRIVLERLTTLDDGGDHVCFVGSPVNAELAPDGAPMRVADAADVDPGHEADERAAPADLGADERPPDDHGSPMDAADRRGMENAAAGAGHAVDLSPDAPQDRGGTSADQGHEPVRRARARPVARSVPVGAPAGNAVDAGQVELARPPHDGVVDDDHRDRRARDAVAEHQHGDDDRDQRGDEPAHPGLAKVEWQRWRCP